VSALVELDISTKKMVLEVNGVLAKHEFNVQLISYVKDERGNPSTMTQALTSIVSCEKLGLAHPFVRSCWGHVISNVVNMPLMILKFVLV